MDVVRVMREADVAVVMLNRPAQRNAMSAELVAALIAALQALGADAAVRAIVLAGAGSGFCAGSDLAGLAAMSAAGRRQFEAESGRLARLIETLPQPVVAAAEGFAIGGGLTLAAACDLVVSGAKAKWALPEVPIGLFPAWGLAAVVERVGLPKARRLAWGIDTLSGEEACAMGLVDVLAEGAVLEAAMGLARRLAALPGPQSTCVKQYFLMTRHAGAEAADVLADEFFMQASVTAEAEASFRKFAGK